MNPKNKNKFKMKCVGPKGCNYEGPSENFNSKKKKGAFACPKCRKNNFYLIMQTSIVNPKTLPIIMIGLQLITGIIYFYCSDLRRGFYWLAATVLTITITF